MSVFQFAVFEKINAVDDPARNGSVEVVHSSVTIHNCEFIHNSLTATIVNNTFFSHTRWNVGGGLAVSGTHNGTIENNIFYENASRIEGPNMQTLNSDSSEYFAKYNFLGTDALGPRFYSSSDFHPNSSSLCIHTGDPAPQFNNVDGSRNDQGAYGGPLGIGERNEN
jgi:hypothetical protein